MFADVDRYRDQSEAAESAAVHALAAVVRLKSAVELRTLCGFDFGQRELFLRSLDTMLICAMTCLKATHRGRAKAMAVASDPLRRRRPVAPKLFGSAERH